MRAQKPQDGDIKKEPHKVMAEKGTLRWVNWERPHCERDAKMDKG